MANFKLKPVVSEKSNDLMSLKKFVFLILGESANKIQLKQYFEKELGAEVSQINVLKRLGKKRRRGMVTGKVSDRTKVIVTAKDDKSVEKIKALF